MENNNNKHVVVPENVVLTWNDVSNWCKEKFGNLSLVGFEKVGDEVIAQLE